jgi:hypothetical protein
MLAVQPVERLASVLQVRRISSPMILGYVNAQQLVSARTGKPILEQLNKR